MIFRQAIIELLRLATRPMYVIAFAVLTMLGAGLMLFHTHGHAPPSGIDGVWTAWSMLFAKAVPVFLLTPMFIGFIAGASLAEDRRTGYQQLAMVRVNSSTKWVLGKIIGIFTASFIGSSLSCLLLASLSFLLFPTTPLDVNAVVFNPALFLSSPYLYLGLTAVMVGLSSGAMAGVACLASVWIKNPYAVGAAPVGFFFFAAFFTPPLESLLGFQLHNLNGLLTLQGTGLSFTVISFSWLALIAAFYGGTVIFWGQENIL